MRRRRRRRFKEECRDEESWRIQRKVRGILGKEE
jgi:hypothetical protein